MAEKKKRGGQRGNQNARTHGFYSKVLDAAGKRNLAVASDIEGIDYEIAILRVKIRNVLEKDPENIIILMTAARTLAGLLKTSAELNKNQKKNVRESIGQLIKELALQAGIQATTTLIGKQV